MNIKKFSIEYEPINSRNTFTNGDTIYGRIIVEVSKKTKIKSLIFIAQGKAQVCWSENYEDNNITFQADETYYDVEHHILREGRQDGTEVIGKARHEYPFSFKIPDGKIPSSFESSNGKIVHILKAELKLSMKLTKNAKTHFTFVSKADTGIYRLMEPQYGHKDKSVKVFGSGNVSMDVHIKKMGYEQGEALQVTVEVSNHSTRSVKPKFTLYEIKSLLAQGNKADFQKKILKEKTEAVASSKKQTVTKVITIPKDLTPSIRNCSILKLEYWLKIYLDVKYSSNPKIHLPIVVLPSSEDPAMKQPPAAAGGGFPAFGNPDQVLWSTAPQPQAAPQYVDPPPPYGAYAMYPVAF